MRFYLAYKCYKHLHLDWVTCQWVTDGGSLWEGGMGVIPIMAIIYLQFAWILKKNFTFHFLNQQLATLTIFIQKRFKVLTNCFQ